MPSSPQHVQVTSHTFPASHQTMRSIADKHGQNCLMLLNYNEDLTHAGNVLERVRNGADILMYLDKYEVRSIRYGLLRGRLFMLCSLCSFESHSARGSNSIYPVDLNRFSKTISKHVLVFL